MCTPGAGSPIFVICNSTILDGMVEYKHLFGEGRTNCEIGGEVGHWWKNKSIHKSKNTGRFPQCLQFFFHDHLIFLIFHDCVSDNIFHTGHFVVIIGKCELIKLFG